IERHLTQYVSKYKRYMKVTKTLAAHNPQCMAAKVGDAVTVGETRKLSKTKAFVVTAVKKAE
ncbi:MAG TPA: 30S ribosomal protein S17, partial [archaeon]|nr:30S ribosomal protein S17 [archaeon]